MYRLVLFADRMPPWRQRGSRSSQHQTCTNRNMRYALGAEIIRLSLSLKPSRTPFAHHHSGGASRPAGRYRSKILQSSTSYIDAAASGVLYACTKVSAWRVDPPLLLLAWSPPRIPRRAEHHPAALGVAPNRPRSRTPEECRAPGPGTLNKQSATATVAKKKQKQGVSVSTCNGKTLQSRVLALFRVLICNYSVKALERSSGVFPCTTYRTKTCLYLVHNTCTCRTGCPRHNSPADGFVCRLHMQKTRHAHAPSMCFSPRESCLRLDWIRVAPPQPRRPFRALYEMSIISALVAG